MFKVSVEGSFLYPLSCWDKHFFRSMYPVSWFRAACSRTLENASNRDMGRLLFGTSGAFSLRTD